MFAPCKDSCFVRFDRNPSMFSLESRAIASDTTRLSNFSSAEQHLDKVTAKTIKANGKFIPLAIRVVNFPFQSWSELQYDKSAQSKLDKLLCPPQRHTSMCLRKCISLSISGVLGNFIMVDSLLEA